MDNTLNVDSLWVSNNNDHHQYSALEHIKVRFITEANAKNTDLQPRHVIVHAGGKGNRNGLVIGCYTDGKVSRKKAECPFGLTAHEKTKGSKDAARLVSFVLLFCNVML